MKILLVTNDRIGERRAGPAIRCVELAEVLSKYHEVTLASALPGQCDSANIRFIFNARADAGALRKAARACDIVITQGLVLSLFPFLSRIAKYLVVELYDPYLFENAYLPHRNFPHWAHLRQWYLLNQQLLRGDFFTCANERQWSYWLGRLCALGRLTLEQHRLDPTLRSLLAVVPFGIRSGHPQHTKRVAKGVIPGIASSDILLLWAGGIWQWFDPLSLIRAMHQVSQECADVKLLFLGAQYSDPPRPVMPIVAEAIQLARDLQVLDRCVYFHYDWVPFDEMPNFLLEADVGVSAYPASVETYLAFRTRVREYLWAGLPMILTQGDSFADLVEKEELGRTVPPGDVEGWKKAILEMARDSKFRSMARSRVQALAPEFRWDKVAEPLLNYCRQPYRPPRTPRIHSTLVPLLSAAYQQFSRFVQ